jgi:hypothetical protein
VSSISIAGSVIDRADRLSQASESRTAAPLSTIDSLLCELPRDPPAAARLAAELRVAVAAASESSAGSRVIGLSPGPSNVAPAADAPALQPAAVEDPVPKELDRLLARLNAALASSPKPPKRKFFR